MSSALRSIAIILCVSCCIGISPTFSSAQARSSTTTLTTQATVTTDQRSAPRMDVADTPTAGISVTSYPAESLPIDSCCDYPVPEDILLNAAHTATTIARDPSKENIISAVISFVITSLGAYITHLVRKRNRNKNQGPDTA